MTVIALWFVLAVSTALCIYSWVVLPSLASKRLNESMAAFSKAIELRFPSRQGLSSEAVALCRLVGKQMKLGRSSLLDLEMACWLRDVGLCSTPYQLLNCKPRSSWTMEEEGLYRQHTLDGSAMLEQVPALRHLSQIVLHYEADYSPLHDIPVEARVLKVVTTFLWHSQLVGDEEAAQKLDSQLGQTLDPRVVQALVEVLRSHHGTDFRTAKALA